MKVVMTMIAGLLLFAAPMFSELASGTDNLPSNTISGN